MIRLAYAILLASFQARAETLVMDLRYIDDSGQEIGIQSLAEIQRHLREERLDDDRQVYDKASKRWVRATEHADYCLAKASLHISNTKLSRAATSAVHADTLHRENLPTANVPAVTVRTYATSRVVLALLTLLLLIAVPLLTRSSPRFFAEFAGTCVGTSVVLWIFAVGLLKALRFQRRRFPLFSYALVFVATVLGCQRLLESSVLRESTSRSITNITNDYTGWLKGHPLPLRERDNSSSRLAESSSQQTREHARAVGDLATISHFINAAAIEASQDYHAFERKLAENGAGNLLDHLGDLQLMLKARSRIPKLRQVHDWYKGLLHNRKVQALSKLRATMRDPVLISKFERSFLKAARATKVLWGEFFGIQRALLNQCEQLLSFLIDKHGKYEMAASRLVFVSLADSQRYNRSMARLRELLAADAAWRNKFANEAGKRLTRFKDHAWK